MKNVLLIVLITLSLNAYAQYQGKNFIDHNYIEVTGTAEMEVAPNEIFLNIIIDEKSLKGKDIEATEKMMIDQLDAIGIDTSTDLVLKDMISNFRYYWLKGTINSVREYQVLVHDTKYAGQVFKGLNSIGISNISIYKAQHSEIQKYKSQVKVLAIKAAQEKAKSLTSAINQSIGKALYIEELNNPLVQDFRRNAMANVALKSYSPPMEEDNVPEIAFEKIKLEHAVLVRFELLD